MLNENSVENSLLNEIRKSDITSLKSTSSSSDAIEQQNNTLDLFY